MASAWSPNPAKAPLYADLPYGDMRDNVLARWAANAPLAFIEGQRHDVPAAVDRTVYRIVQESLTNVARHAGAATASVRIHWSPNTLAIRIDDDGKAAPATAPVPGLGLLGMRERVTALGGRLCAEPRGGGGFTVQAELPVDRTS